MPMIVDVLTRKVGVCSPRDDPAVKPCGLCSTWPLRRDLRKAKEDSGVVPFGVVNQT